MKNAFSHPALSCLLLGVLLQPCNASIAREQVAAGSGPTPNEPRNIILIIGDGMDDQQISIARNYLQGASGRLTLDQMPLRAAMGVLTIEDEVGGQPVYVADSANTATSIATGAVTSRGRIATTAGTDKDLVTIAELAAAAGYRTGIVTTASVTDATPASFAAHVSMRLCEGPDTMVDISYRDIPLGGCPADLLANGGRGSISQQLANSALDVLLGGGRKHFEQTAESAPGVSTTSEGNKSVLDLARQRGFQVVTTTAELSSAPSQGRLLGLFSPGTMPVRLQGEDGRAAEHAKPSLLNRVHRYLGDVSLPPPMECKPNPAVAGVPDLQQMADVALAHLSSDNARGFFLMIESASIDKQAHERKPCGSIGELQQLEEALASALAFAKTQAHTLVIVTADHSQAAQLLPAQSLYAAFPIPIYSPGMVARIRTPEGSLMAVNYATNNFSHEEHTGANVPLFSNEEGRKLLPSYLVQPELFGIMRDYLSL